MANYGYTTRSDYGTSPVAGFLGGAFEGLNMAFNEHMDRKYRKDLEDKTYLQRTIESVDIPQVISDKHKNDMNAELAKLKQKVLMITMNKPKGIRGFLGDAYNTEDLLTIQSEANTLMKRFSQLASTDKQVAKEWEIIKKDILEGTNIFDHDQAKVLLDLYIDKGTLTNGTILSKQAVNLDQYRIALMEQTKKEQGGQIGITEERDDKKKMQFKTLHFGDPVKSLRGYRALVGDEAGRKAIVLEMINKADPNQVAKDLKDSGMTDVMSAYYGKMMTIAKNGGRKKELEYDPIFQQVAIQWGLDNVAPTLLRDIKVEVPYEAPKATEDKEEEFKAAKRVENLTMPDGTEAPVGYQFKKAITKTIPAEQIRDLHNNKIESTGEQDVEIDQIGGAWAYGSSNVIKEISEAEYEQLGGEDNDALSVVEDRRPADQGGGNKYYISKKMPVKIPLVLVQTDVENKISEIKGRIKKGTMGHKPTTSDTQTSKTTTSGDHAKSSIPDFVKPPVPFNADEYRQKYKY